MPKINPAILTWARESAGLDVESAARAIGLTGANAAERLAQLEAGTREPTRTQLIKMSEKYRRPLLTFYLTEPPSPAPQTLDFRNLRERDPDREALLNALVRDVKTRQVLVREALEDADEVEPVQFVGSVERRTGATALANAMSEALRFDRQAYRAARTFDDAFRILRDAVESIGVFVILMGNLGHHTSNLSPKVFRGMAIADPFAPFIVINETDSRSAWSFTLLHELGHIFLGQTGISGYDGAEEIERLCDSAAAEFLLDRAELNLIEIVPDRFAEFVEAIGAFAYARKVSRKMVAYNLLRASFIPIAVYGDLAARFDEDRLDFAQRAQAGGAPDYYVVRRHRVGTGLIRLVKRMVHEGALSSTKAGKVLGVKPTAVGRMTERAA